MHSLDECRTCKDHDIETRTILATRSEKRSYVEHAVGIGMHQIEVIIGVVLRGIETPGSIVGLT